MKHLVSTAVVMAALVIPGFASSYSGAVCKPATATDVSKADYPIGFSGLGIKNNTSASTVAIVCPIVENSFTFSNVTRVTWTATTGQIVCALKRLSSDGTVLQANFGSLQGSGALNISQSGMTGVLFSVDCQLPAGGTLNTIQVNVVP
jgi:hypothetical protein